MNCIEVKGNPYKGCLFVVLFLKSHSKIPLCHNPAKEICNTFESLLLGCDSPADRNISCYANESKEEWNEKTSTLDGACNRTCVSIY